MKNRSLALITGANRGLGLETARQLSEKEFIVFLSARSREAGEAAVKELQSNGAEVRFVELEVTEIASIRSAAQAVAAHVDHLDVLVNNAAILEGENASVLHVTAESLQRTLAVNTVGPLLVAQAFVPLLSRSKRARIINVSSGAGSLHDMETYAPAYSISKAALNAVTRQLAAALRSKHIAVNSVCPGWVRTDMGGSSAPLAVAEGADTIVWLATEAPQSLTGQFLQDRQVIPW
jgi:NAD(P)-dependent dehydrogenase (short-subunit alcohol dehydrogenase family)